MDSNRERYIIKKNPKLNRFYFCQKINKENKPLILPIFLYDWVGWSLRTSRQVLSKFKTNMANTTRLSSNEIQIFSRKNMINTEKYNKDINHGYFVLFFFFNCV